LKQRGADPRDFPPELDLGGVRFPLAYRFDPGTEDDGVTLLVPLAALNQVPTAPCDWLVPGLLEEKIAALIKVCPSRSAAPSCRCRSSPGGLPGFAPSPAGGRGSG
jgi:hypothetical protein